MKTIAIKGKVIEVNLLLEKLRKKYGNITLEELINKLEESKEFEM